MFDDLLDDLFDRDRRHGGKRRGGLLGRLTRLAGDDDRSHDDRHRDDDRDHRRHDDEREHRQPRKRRRELFDFDD